MGARSVEHAGVVDQPRDRMAAARAAKAVRAETRNRLRALKDVYFERFETYLAAADTGTESEIRAARSAAWDAHHAYAYAQQEADAQSHPRGHRR